MTMDAANWLATRTGDAPAALMDEMLAALPADAPTVPDALAAAACALYRRVLEGAGGREAALPLLAADALLTHAFQAQAELEPSAIEEFAGRWDAGGGLGSLLR